MTTTLVTDEFSNHKLAAVFRSDGQAREIASALPAALGLQPVQVLLLAPGDPFPERKLEPESRGIARTLVVSHVRLGIAGMLAGLALFAVLYLAGLPLVVQSALAAALVATGFGLVAGLMLGGLVSLRPDHDRYVLAAQEAIQRGDTALVVHAYSRAERDAAADWLRARGAEVTTTL